MSDLIIRNKIEEELSRITDILNLAKGCYQYCYYLHKPKTVEEDNYLKHSRDFNFIRHILFRMTIIELMKLFSDSKSGKERYNICRFLKKFKKGGVFFCIGLDQYKIEQWEMQIQSKELLIKELKDLRDKAYAHTDANKENYTDVNIEFANIEYLLKIVEDIVSEIFVSKFDTFIDFDSPFFDFKKIEIIKILANERQKRIDDIIHGVNFEN